jgi:hypothetical protein
VANQRAPLPFQDAQVEILFLEEDESKNQRNLDLEQTVLQEKKRA